MFYLLRRYFKFWWGPCKWLCLAKEWGNHQEFLEFYLVGAQHQWFLSNIYYLAAVLLRRPIRSGDRSICEGDSVCVYQEIIWWRSGKEKRDWEYLASDLKIICHTTSDCLYRKTEISCPEFIPSTCFVVKFQNLGQY